MILQRSAKSTRLLKSDVIIIQILRVKNVYFRNRMLRSVL